MPPSLSKPSNLKSPPEALTLSSSTSLQQKDEDRLALKRQKDRERKRRGRARKAIAKQEAKALAADAAMVKKEGEAMGEASVDDIFNGGLNIGKCELDKEVSYLVFIVSMQKVSLYKSINKIHLSQSHISQNRVL